MWRVGESVKVRSGTVDPDLEIDISGWQGRITEVLPDENLICIAWDSKTLRQMPDEIIEACEESGLDWRVMYLAFEDVERAEPRDRQEDVARVTAKLAHRHAWVHLGEQGRRIQRILKGLRPDDVEGALQRWAHHLRRRLRFPIHVVVYEPPPPNLPIAWEDRLRLIGIRQGDTEQGLLADVITRRGHRQTIPLSILGAVKERSKAGQLLDDYSVWWENRSVFSINP